MCSFLSPAKNGQVLAGEKTNAIYLIFDFVLNKLQRLSFFVPPCRVVPKNEIAF